MAGATRKAVSLNLKQANEKYIRGKEDLVKAENALNEWKEEDGEHAIREILDALQNAGQNLVDAFDIMQEPLKQEEKEANENAHKTLLEALAEDMKVAEERLCKLSVKLQFNSFVLAAAEIAAQYDREKHLNDSWGDFTRQYFTATYDSILTAHREDRINWQVILNQISQFDKLVRRINSLIASVRELQNEELMPSEEWEATMIRVKREIEVTTYNIEKILEIRQDEAPGDDFYDADDDNVEDDTNTVVEDNSGAGHVTKNDDQAPMGILGNGAQVPAAAPPASANRTSARKPVSQVGLLKRPSRTYDTMLTSQTRKSNK